MGLVYISIIIFRQSCIQVRVRIIHFFVEKRYIYCSIIFMSEGGSETFYFVVFHVNVSVFIQLCV